MRRFDSLEDYTYTVTWTRDGEGWHTAAFKTRDEALGFVADMLDENRGNREFTWYASRIATLDVGDFLDDSVPDVKMRFANPWLCSSNGEDDEPDEGEDSGVCEDDSDVVRRALLDVIEECRENACGEAASERLRAMAEAAAVILAAPIAINNLAPCPVDD